MNRNLVISSSLVQYSKCPLYNSFIHCMSLRMNERTSSVVICEPTPVTMESSFREVGRMWQLHSGNFVVSRSFLRSTRSFVDGVVVNEKKRKYDYKTSQFNAVNDPSGF
ncbi:uncharacterized protein LOC107964590 [Apis mellifera]|uniref:Uncharacterized protein LOC107964590 n=1 Tax=Apis mellifera TaxID=7460 RepID=A0A7M7M4H3_APIME|nr:uncharacterized protein LOC107964590 [Apis mellifera]|eukprot:XP_016768132.1 uncharacterized protein LOC107964590 [Apis mellifera]